jgi:integration host factor subunit alpha
MTLTKLELVNELIETLDIKKEVSKKLVDVFFEELRSVLEQGKQIKLSGFGRFELRDKTSRPGRNPKTGEEVTITPRRVVTFKAGHKLKERVADFVEDDSLH